MKKALWFLFSLKGRISRKPFVVFILISHLTVFLSTHWANTYWAASSFSLSATWPLMIPGLIGTAFIWPMFAICVKRLHDLNRQSVWAWIIFIKPVVAAITTYFVADIYLSQNIEPTGLDWLINWPVMFLGYYILLLQLCLALIPGTKGPNRYGPSPKEKTAPIEATFE